MASVLERLESRTRKSQEVFKRTREVVAQEVVGTVDMPYPLYIKEAKGSRITDVDGNEYIDMTMGFGPHILGHAPDVVVEAVTEAVARGLQFGLHNPYQEPLASLIVEAGPCADKVVFTNSGTEATMYGVRVARSFTGKSKIGMFDGGYHGVHDQVLAGARPESPRNRPVAKSLGGGIPLETTEQVILLPYREDEAFEIIREHKDELAVVMIEGVQSSNPRLDHGDFLRQLQQVCRECGVLFLIDEVITGFRLGYGGAQQYFDVVPDLAAYGKIIGGGTPIGALAGSDDIMQVFSPSRDSEQSGPRQIFSGGTFSGNPISMIAGHAAVNHLKNHPELYSQLEERGARLSDGINSFCMAEELPVQMMSAQSLFYLRFQRAHINSSRDIDSSLHDAEIQFYLHLLERGVVVPGIHMGLISTAHTDEDVDMIVDAMKESLKDVRKMGML